MFVLPKRGWFTMVLIVLLLLIIIFLMSPVAAFWIVGILLSLWIISNLIEGDSSRNTQKESQTKEDIQNLKENKDLLKAIIFLIIMMILGFIISAYFY
jgi:Na+/melibiose symporter-like transporter